MASPPHFLSHTGSSSRGRSPAVCFGHLALAQLLRVLDWSSRPHLHTALEPHPFLSPKGENGLSQDLNP